MTVENIMKLLEDYADTCAEHACWMRHESWHSEDDIRELVALKGKEHDALLAAVEELAKDAERYKHLEKQFNPMGLDINGNHAWIWRGNPANTRGPSLGEAIDAAIKS